MDVKDTPVGFDTQILLEAFELMCTAKEMAILYEANKEVTSKYVHATSRGHEAIQIALGMQLEAKDYVAPYYRDDSILLSIGYKPYDLMLQLLAKKDDPFSGGRTYYSHPSSNRDDIPKIPHQSSATGMQAIPTTGLAHGLQYLDDQGLLADDLKDTVVVCSLGDASVTEGEVAEAFHIAALKQLPILFLVQDNEWDISAHSSEVRAMDANYYARGFKGLRSVTVDGSDMIASYETLNDVLGTIRKERRPYLVHAKVPLLNHHTSGVRKEWYRSEADLAEHNERDPYPVLRDQLMIYGVKEEEVVAIEEKVRQQVQADYERALDAADPSPEDLTTHIFAPSPITEEQGERTPAGKEKVVMVDAALHAVDEILRKHPEALLYGQDVGGELGGVFREAALLAKKYGDGRVFNTPIQEAYILGSTVGMSIVGCKPIVEVQFADYIWPGLNQLFTELSRSYYLSNGKWNVQSLIRVPIGAYGSGGPYHSSSVESVLLQIKGIKVVYPSNAADMKGLLKGAFYDPNPVLILEHKGLYWSKVPGTAEAKTVEPDEDYVLPLGKGRIALETDGTALENGETLTVITYGMGVHWAMNAAKQYPGQVEVVDLRSLNPLDEELIYSSVQKHNKCLVLTEETLNNSFAEALAGKISLNCFEHLDAPVQVMGSVNTPAIPLNSVLEQAMLPNADKVAERIGQLLEW